MNLVIALDCSGSIGFWSWFKELEFVRLLVRKMDLPYSVTRVGLVVFHDEAAIYVNITKDGASAKRIITTLKSLRSLWEPHKRTYTHLALNLAVQMLEEAKKTRPLPSTLLLVTDGQSSFGWPSLVNHVNSLQRNTVDTYCVGVGPQADYSELRYIARNTDNVFLLKDFSELKTVTPVVVSKLCNDNRKTS